MQKSTEIAACLAMGLAAGLGGCATRPAGDQAALAATNTPQCVKDTGTRIQDPDRSCVAQPGAAYSQRDIQLTGETDTAAALKKLDPRLQ